MFKLIAGNKGCGKSKQIIDMANEKVQEASGNGIFIADDSKHMYELKHDLRFISMDEFPVSNEDTFFGFLCGMISNNYDIEVIYIDGVQKIAKLSDMAALQAFVQRVDALAQKFSIQFVYTANVDEDTLPEALKAKMI